MIAVLELQASLWKLEHTTLAFPLRFLYLFPLPGDTSPRTLHSYYHSQLCSNDDLEQTSQDTLLAGKQ